MLRRMISNLVDNAVQHSPDGGTVSVGLRHESGRFRITVTDQGPGVPDAQRERVFDRFFRIDKSRSRAQRQSGGAGLGLAIARWIAEAHGGTLTLQSSGAQGSCFEISLPRSASPSPRATDSPRV
jgi:signal transduction histidine kinase